VKVEVGDLQDAAVEGASPYKVIIDNHPTEFIEIL